MTEEERRHEIREIKALLEELHIGARRQIEEMERLRQQISELEIGNQGVRRDGELADEGA